MENSLTMPLQEMDSEDTSPDELIEGSEDIEVIDNENLANNLDDSQKREIARLVVDEFEDDLSSRSGWITKHDEFLELYHQTHKGSVSPMSGASTDCLPIITEGCNIFQARAYKAFFPNRDFLQAIPIDSDDDEAQESAERIAKRYSYELTVKKKDYKRDKNAMFLALPLHGSDFTKVYFCRDKKEKVIERVRAEDLVVPYGNGPRSIEDLPRKTHIIKFPIYKANRLHKTGFFIEELSRDDATYDKVERLTAYENAEGLTESTNRGKSFYGEILEQHRWLDIEGEELPYIVWVDRTSERLLRIEKRYKDDFEPIEQFTHYPFLPNPDGFYGLGLGHLAAPINKTCNTMLRKIIDAATLANDGNLSGFISDFLGVEGGDIELEMGKFKKIGRNASDLKQGIFTFDFQGANPALVEMMQYMQGIAQRLISATDVVSGDMEKVYQPQTVATMLDSALQLPTSVMEQLAVSFEDELAKYYELDRNNLDYIKFSDGKDGLELKPEDFQYGLKIVPVIDPRNITKQQKMAKAQALYQMTLENPMLAQSPDSLRYATRKVLEAMEVEDLDRIMPPPPEPQQIDNQDIENMYFMLPKDERPDFDVYPNQDHKDHIIKIDRLLGLLDESQTPDVQAGEADESVLNAIIGMGDQIKQEIAAELMQHRRKHIAYLYAQENGVFDGQGTDSSMAGDARNQMATQGSGYEGQPISGYNGLSAGESGVLQGASISPEYSGEGGNGQIPQGIVGVGSLDYGQSLQ